MTTNASRRANRLATLAAGLLSLATQTAGWTAEGVPAPPNAPPARQIMVELRLCEVAVENGLAPAVEKQLGLSLTNAQGGRPASSALAANPEDEIQTAILTGPQFRQILGKLEKQSGVNLLSAPKLTTLSGRQAQIKVADIQHIVTMVVSRPETNAPAPVSEPFEIGVSVDLVPIVLEDGKTVSLTIIPKHREFLGYDDAAKAIPAPLPRFRVWQAACTAAVGDGQTLVLTGGPVTEEVIRQGVTAAAPPKAKATKRLLLFATPRLIDAEGKPLAP